MPNVPDGIPPCRLTLLAPPTSSNSSQIAHVPPPPQISRVHTIVFDECHHAQKKHPYNLIMKEFYHRGECGWVDQCCPLEMGKE